MSIAAPIAPSPSRVVRGVESVGTSGFPVSRLRRTRQTPALRGLVRETRLAPSQFIQPLFIVPGRNVRSPIDSMPGVDHLSVDQAVQECRNLVSAGVRAVLLFGVPESKDERASGAYAPDGTVQRAVAEIKAAFPDLVVITDVCLCQYTSNGHCGVVVGETIDNDRSLELLTKTALSHARAGADVVAPSDMMDGRVAAMRQALEADGFHNVVILSYAAKYASGFYGPFRDAVDSAPQYGDRRSHQMDPPNRREALREIEQDIAEGADIVMVKPALAYLDVIAHARQKFDIPLAAYSVSGEYSMFKAAAAKGWIDERRVVTEALTGISRAGADIIITYYATQMARWLAEPS